MALANDLRKGMAIRYNGNPAIVLEVQHRTPGNLRAFVQAIIRYINTGKSADVRFSSTEKVDLVDVSRQQLEFSYSDPQGYHFIDPETYDTITLQAELVAVATDLAEIGGGAVALNLLFGLPLVTGALITTAVSTALLFLQVDVLNIEGRPAQVELPSSVTLRVTESAEGVRGDSANNVQKPATLETGKIVQVPLFIKEGESIKIDTRTGVYMSRA